MADENLCLPLLNEDHHLAIDIEPNGKTTRTAPPAESTSNPFRFLGVPDLHVPPPSSIDPFRNQTPSVEGVYEWAKIVICMPVALVRLVLFGSALAIGYLVTKLALAGWKDRQSPMPKWRSRMMWVTRICSRCILFSWG